MVTRLVWNIVVDGAMGVKICSFLHCKEQNDMAHVQTNAQNGEVGAVSQTSTTRQRRREQEAAKESSVSRLEAQHYLQIQGDTDVTAELKGRDNIPGGREAGKIDDAACKCAAEDVISIIC